MGMALDEPTDNDEVIELDDFKVVAEKSLVSEMGGIEVRYRDVGYGGGFVISAKSDYTGGCSC
jgi:Fe-S cluster assembly iron-binding protein IscA